MIPLALYVSPRQTPFLTSVRYKDADRTFGEGARERVREGIPSLPRFPAPTHLDKPNPSPPQNSYVELTFFRAQKTLEPFPPQYTPHCLAD